MEWLGGLILLLAFAYIPLSAWGATGRLERAWEAARQYLKVIALFAVVGGGAGMVAAVNDHGMGALWAMLTGR